MKTICPNCKASLTFSALVSNGTRIQCPACSKEFIYQDTSNNDDKKQSTHNQGPKKAIVIILSIVAVLLAINTYYTIPWPVEYQYRWMSIDLPRKPSFHDINDALIKTFGKEAMDRYFYDIEIPAGWSYVDMFPDNRILVRRPAPAGYHVKNSLYSQSFESKRTDILLEILKLEREKEEE